MGTHNGAELGNVDLAAVDGIQQQIPYPGRFIRCISVHHADGSGSTSDSR